MKLLFGFVASAAVFCFSASAATHFGNGNSGFGDPIGLVGLTLTDDSTTIFDTVNNGFPIGLTPGSDATFGLFGTYPSNSGFRSDEAAAGNATGSTGWNPFLQTAFGTYTPVPEPSTLTLFGLAALSGLICFRRKK